MVVGHFDGHVVALSAVVVDVIKDYLQRNGMPWDAATFKKFGQTDLEQLAKDALCFGADTYPEEQHVSG